MFVVLVEDNALRLERRLLECDPLVRNYRRPFFLACICDVAAQILNESKDPFGRGLLAPELPIYVCELVRDVREVFRISYVEAGGRHVALLSSWYGVYPTGARYPFQAAII